MIREWPLAGRGEELERVTRAVFAGSGSAGVVLAGAPGVGKTRLAREALAVARRRGAVTPWVVATSSAAAIPLGALARLLPPLPSGPEPRGLQLLHQAMGALMESAGGRRLVLGVDDAHLIDDTSATLVHQLVLSEAAAVVLTVRSGQPAPDSVVALWKDGLVEHIELLPLARSQVEQLVANALGGPVESATLERLWQLTKGNALFVREVVEGARAGDQLVMRAGVWRWEGEFSPTPLLAELLQRRLGRLTTTERGLVEALAFGEPLGLPLAAELASPVAVRQCERSGVVTVEDDGRRRQVRLTHPLYAEVIRTKTSALGAADVRRALVRAQASGRLRRRGDVLRQATLQLEAEGSGDPDLLLTAARQASDMDPALAERMARAAIAGGGGFDARLVLAAALNGQVRVADAEEALREATAMASDPEQRAAAALAWAPNLFWAQGRAEEADAMLGLAQTAGASRAVSHRLLSMRAAFSLFQGRPLVTVELAGQVLESSSATDEAVVAAAAPASHALARCGRTTESLAANAKGWAALERSPQMTQFRSPLLHSEVTAQIVQGGLRQAAARAEEYHRDLLARPWTRAGLLCACVLRGQAALAQGQLLTAARWLQEATGAPLDLEPVAWLYWCLLSLTEALAVRGDAKGAEEALAKAGTVHRPVFVLWAPDALMAEAWVAVAKGESTRASSLFAAAADDAAASGQSAIEALARHSSVRLGESAPVVDRLQALAEEIDGDLAACFSAHAGRHAADDGGGLDEVSTRFEALGAVLLAAEVAAEAAAAHQRAGRRASSLGSAARARDLAARCEGATTPALQLDAPSALLTRREREVAGLAGRGLTNRAIAERLVLSVRTVENHLDQAYAKLGIHNRAELATALGIDSGPGKK